jgi:hypothetical protein
MKVYPQTLSEESLDKLAKIFPDTAADLRCWKHALDLGDIYNYIVKTTKEEYD